MAKKITKSRKPKIVRSSSIEKTINEGKDYVKRADKRLRFARKENKNNVIAETKTNKQKKIAKIRKPKKNSRVSQAPRVLLPASSSAPVPATTVSPVVRSGSKNLSKAGSKNNVLIQQQLQYRLGRENARIGKLNFSLRWWDPNDLDLHVICPCGTEIYYANKKCTKCNGELDVDMNVGSNMSLEPVEHVYFNLPKPGLYKFFVRYFFGPKEFSGVKGAQKSKYALSLHQDMNQIFRYEDTVSLTQRQVHYDFTR